MHFYTGTRMTDDIDAVFDRKILVPADATVIYRDAQGKARSVYFAGGQQQILTIC